MAVWSLTNMYYVQILLCIMCRFLHVLCELQSKRACRSARLARFARCGHPWYPAIMGHPHHGGRKTGVNVCGHPIIAGYDGACASCPPYGGVMGYPLGALILGALFRCIPPPRGIKLGDVYFIKMLDLCYGCGLRRSKVFSFYTKSDLFLLFLVVGRPQGQKVGAFLSKNNENR